MPTAAQRYNFPAVEQDGKNFMSELFKQSNVHSVGGAKQENMMRIGNKDVLAKKLVEALALIERQNMLIINQRVHVSAYEQDIIKLQNDVINAQRKAMDQFKIDMTRQVSKTVADTVQSGLTKSYSEAVKSFSTCSTGTTVSKETIKTVAQQVVIEEELSKNLMVFGLPENESDSDVLCEKVAEVFSYLDEKPNVKTNRVGKIKDSSVRPVKVTFSSATTVQRLLAKSSKLRQSTDYKTVFLAPDRTVEQRSCHRELVSELKQKRIAEPEKKHYIKEGKIYSADKILVEN